MVRRNGEPMRQNGRPSRASQEALGAVDEAEPVELSDDQLEHVVGGLARPAVDAEQLAALLEQTVGGSDSLA